MTSREDPFPLVNLEMGLNGSPVLCFGGTGGSEEIVIKENIFKYFDILSMAKRVKFYKENLPSLKVDSKLSIQRSIKFTKNLKLRRLRN